MRTVFLDYETVRNGDGGLDPSAIERASRGRSAIATLPRMSQIPERIGAAEIVLLNKVKLSRASSARRPT